MRKIGRTINKAWVAVGLSHAITGMIFGCLVSALIVAALAMKFGPAEALERRGIDLSMRLSTVLFSAGESVDNATPIVFLDIDTRSCEQLAAQPIDCRTRQIGNVALLKSLGLSLSNSEAKLIVLDMRWPPEQMVADFDNWRKGFGPPVIAALPAAPGIDRAISFDWKRLPGGKLKSERLTFASPTWFQSPKFDDGVLRYVEPTVEFQAEGSGVQQGKVDTLLGAALRKLGASEIPETRDAKVYWINFTLPALSLAANEKLRSEFLGNFTYRPLSSVFPDSDCRGEGCYKGVDWSELKGKIVVVGSSAPSADDWHVTPLGLMSGPELLANAIRSGERNTTLQSADYKKQFSAKISETVFSAALMLPFWLLIAFFKDRAHRKNSRTKLKLRIYSIVALITGFFTVLLVGVSGSVSELATNQVSGKVTDILLPTLAIFFEAFVDFAKWFTMTIEKYAHQCSKRLLAMIGRFV